MSGVIFWYFLSDMRFQAEMGLLMALWMFVSMIGGLVLLPTLIYLIKPRFITGHLSHSHPARPLKTSE